MRVTRKAQPKPAAKPATAPPPPIPTPPPSRKCLCRCGADITSKSGIFRPGHDAKAVGLLSRAVVAGEMTLTGALATIEPASDLLKAKVRRSVERNTPKPATAPAEPVDGSAEVGQTAKS